MKTKLIKRVSDLAAILAFLAFLAGNAFAADIRGDVPNAETVVSPYWQSDTGSYTFIAVTHTSLSGMASQIGVKINAYTKDHSAFGTAATFTIQSGTTTRVFIARTTHASINPTAHPTAQFIQGTSNFRHGHIRVEPVTTHPGVAVTGNHYGKFSRCTVPGKCANNNTGNGGGFRDTTMLSYWGAVVIEQNTTGFAMEFIGDMNDSQSPTNICDTKLVTGCRLLPHNAFDASIPPSGPAAP